jgi:TfoX/Sxy family transcriptional regulator of competence genes
MPHDPKRLREIMVDAAPPEVELAFRPMFGGIMAYAEGKPFASLSNVGMALKAKGPLFAELLAVPGAEPLRYEPNAPPSKSYVTVPEDMLDDRDALRDWIARAAASL